MPKDQVSNMFQVCPRTINHAGSEQVKTRSTNFKKQNVQHFYHEDTEHLYHAFMYSLLSSVYPVPAMHSLLVTSDVRIISGDSSIYSLHLE